MLFNNTKTIAILCDSNELAENIKKAFDLTKKVIAEREGYTSITHNQALEEKARLGATRLSIFKYFNVFESHFEFDEAWLKNIYRLADSNYQTIRNEVTSYLPEYAQLIEMTQNDARGLRSDLRLFMHCCWACKFVLLPLSFNELPKVKKGMNGKSYEYAQSAYPEILKIIRAPFYKELECNIELSKHMPESSLSNFSWYAYRYVRSSAAWDVEDITNDLLSSLTEKPQKGYPRTVDWYLALHTCLPQRVKFDRASVYAKSNVGIQGVTGTLSSKNFSQIELKSNPTIPIWIKDINEFVSAVKDRGIKGYSNYQTIIRKAIQTLIQAEDPLPTPKDIKRTHMKQMIAYLNAGVKSSTLKSYLYKLEEFFDYIELTYTGFKSPISRKLDFPISPRSKGTNKEILPEYDFAPYLSYLYGMAEWVWYINEHHPDPEPLIRSMSGNTRSIQTSETGFTPIFMINGKYHPIEEIPIKIMPAFNPKLSSLSQLKSHTLLPHYINISVILAETGIRLMALRWLDAESYDTDINRDLFDEHSYMVTKLWVNTDKAHGPWSADVSETVIGILDRQVAWKKKYLRGPDQPRHYDRHENSMFEMIKPLFAITNPNLELSDSFPVVSDSSYREAFKFIITHFSYIYAKASENHVPPVKVNLDISLMENINQKAAKGSGQLKITPHSFRAQVVSNRITILPPSVIKQATGHVNDAHVMYYVKLDSIYMNAQRASQEQEFKDFLEPVIIDTKSNSSSLRQAFKRNVSSAISDFGAVSFSDQESKVTRNGMATIKNTLFEQMAFNTTHICPFNNECPADIQKDATKGFPKCGECPYSVKTVDNIPSIAAKIRALTDKVSELKTVISEAQNSGESMSGFIPEITLKKYYANEISAWEITLVCLDTMAKNLRTKDKWLVAKPDFISEHLQKCESSNELTNTLIRIKEAQSYQEFLTPQLKARVNHFRNKVLAQTGQFQTLIGDAPTGSSLLVEFKGIIKSICDVSGLTVKELPQALEDVFVDANSFIKPLNLPSSAKKKND